MSTLLPFATRRAAAGRPPRADRATLPAPVRLRDLGAGERLMVVAFRRWVAGEGYWAHCWHDIADSYGGEAGRAVLGALVRLVETMRATAARRVHYHAPCCPCLAADELRLVRLVDVAAAGRLDRAVEGAADLLRVAPVADTAGDTELAAVAEAARCLAAAMAAAPGAPAEDARGPGHVADLALAGAVAADAPPAGPGRAPR